MKSRLGISSFVLTCSKSMISSSVAGLFSFRKSCLQTVSSTEYVGTATDSSSCSAGSRRLPTTCTMANKSKAPDIDGAQSTSSDPLPLRDPGPAYIYTERRLAPLKLRAFVRHKLQQASDENIEEDEGEPALPVEDTSEFDDLEPNYPDDKNPLPVPEKYSPISDGSVNQDPQEERRKKHQNRHQNKHQMEFNKHQKKHQEESKKKQKEYKKQQKESMKHQNESEKHQKKHQKEFKKQQKESKKQQKGSKKSKK